MVCHCLSIIIFFAMSDPKGQSHDDQTFPKSGDVVVQPELATEQEAVSIDLSRLDRVGEIEARLASNEVQKSLKKARGKLGEISLTVIALRSNADDLRALHAAGQVEGLEERVADFDRKIHLIGQAFDRIAD